MNNDIIKHFDENGFAYDKIYLNIHIVNKIKPSADAVIFVDITPQ